MLADPMTTPARARAAGDTLMPTGGVVVGIDIGGTKTAAMVIDADDRVLGKAEQATDRRAPVRVAVETARAALAMAGVAGWGPAGGRCGRARRHRRADGHRPASRQP